MKAASLSDAPEAPPLYTGIVKSIGGAEGLDTAGAMTAFMTAAQLRERVIAERKATAGFVRRASHIALRP